MSSSETHPLRRVMTAPVLVGALGYFVDIFDLLIFPVTSVPSLTELGVPTGELRLVVERILNWQMIGMLLGGIFWGVLGDKLGRRSVLFGSITLYSLANIANGLVHDVEVYRYIRFVAGFGLAGELGAAITLVSETLPKEVRGYGTAIVAGVGVSGAVFGGIVGNFVHWRTAYFIGGALGIALLLLRIGFSESKIFATVKQEGEVSRGNFLVLLWPPKRLLRYLSCIAIGLPLWFGVGILVTQSLHLARELGVTDVIKPATAVAVCYAGLTVGDFASGVLSQILGSRKKAIGTFLALTTLSIVFYCSMHGAPGWLFYAACGFLGFSLGYWAVFVTIASEQFGTNIRATATTTVPNWVRGALVPITILYDGLVSSGLSLVESAFVLGLGLVAVAALALRGLEETHGRSLDFVE